MWIILWHNISCWNIENCKAFLSQLLEIFICCYVGHACFGINCVTHISAWSGVHEVSSSKLFKAWVFVVCRIPLYIEIPVWLAFLETNNRRYFMVLQIIFQHFTNSWINVIRLTSSWFKLHKFMLHLKQNYVLIMYHFMFHKKHQIMVKVFPIL